MGAKQQDTFSVYHRRRPCGLAAHDTVAGRPASGPTRYRAWRTTNARISRRTAGPWRVPKR